LGAHRRIVAVLPSATGKAVVRYKSELFWNQSGAPESIAADLRLAHMFMDLSDSTRDFATAEDCYEKARAAHETVDRLLRRNMPRCRATREELGAAAARLRSRLSAYETAHGKL
jgi:hypothetical protein